MLKAIADKEAAAQEMFPGVIVGVASPYDLPSAINSGEFLVEIPPTIYFKYNEDPEWFFCLYCMFWYKDTGSNHPFDFTGWLDCWMRGRGASWRILRSHFDFVTHLNVGTPVIFSSGDHNPICHLPTNHIKIAEPNLVDMDVPAFRKYEEAPNSIFGDAVSPPWRWREPHGGKAGEIWNDPANFLSSILKTHHLRTR